MKKALLQYLCILAIFNGYVFFNGYLFNYKLPVLFQFELLLAAVCAALPWLFIKKNVFARALLSWLGIMVMLLLHVVAYFAPLELPGSREHNYVMYKICKPAMEKHYASVDPLKRPDTFKVHHRCEQNVWAGRDPLDGVESW